MKEASYTDSRYGAHYFYCLPCKKEWRRQHSLMLKYGMTPDQYAELLDKQDHLCAICHGPPSNSKDGVLHVDHDHETGKVRGLLCHTCNVGLGHFRDQPALIRAASDYLEGYR